MSTLLCLCDGITSVTTTPRPGANRHHVNRKGRQTGGSFRQTCIVCRGDRLHLSIEDVQSHYAEVDRLLSMSDADRIDAAIEGTTVQP